MAHNLTFTMIKPEAMRKGYAGGILKMIQDSGFQVIALKMKHLSTKQAQQFYSMHSEKPFYKDFGKDMFVACKYVFEDDMDKLKDLSKYEVKKRLEKYNYKIHKIHKMKISDVMKIRDKVVNKVGI